MSSLIPVLLGFLFCVSAQAMDRGEALAVLAKWNTPIEGADKPRYPVPGDAEKQAVFKAVEDACAKSLDRDLVLALFEYQLAHPETSEHLSAECLGRIYWDHGKDFIALYESQPPKAQVKLWPYFLYGWQEAVKGKNLSLPKVVQLQKRMDALGAKLINVR